MVGAVCGGKVGKFFDLPSFSSLSTTQIFLASSRHRPAALARRLPRRKNRVAGRYRQPLYYCAMLKRLFLCLSLAYPTVTLPSQLAHGATINQVAQPSQAYFRLADEIAHLFQRATALPTAQGSTLLQKEAPALKKRITPVRTAYRRWLKSLSKSELTAETSAWRRLSGASIFLLSKSLPILTLNSRRSLSQAAHQASCYWT
jgi:hypothetical protein